MAESSLEIARRGLVGPTTISQALLRRALVKLVLPILAGRVTTDTELGSPRLVVYTPADSKVYTDRMPRVQGDRSVSGRIRKF